MGSHTPSSGDLFSFILQRLDAVMQGAYHGENRPKITVQPTIPFQRSLLPEAGREGVKRCYWPRTQRESGQVTGACLNPAATNRCNQQDLSVSVSVTVGPHGGGRETAVHNEVDFCPAA